MWEKGAENLFKEIMAENFPSLGEEHTDLRILESSKKDEHKNPYKDTL